MRVKIVFGYDGEKFNGFQILPNKRTIQGELEKALTKLLNEEIKIIASGRTDAGVSAIYQVAQFDTTSTIIATNISYSVNKILPKDIRVFSSKKVSDNFHARFSAKEKTYRYLFYEGEHLNPYFERTMLWVKGKLDLEKMKTASKYLIGKHDFSAFSTKDEEVKNHVRTIKSIEIDKNEAVFSIKITGNAFLYNMVRIIVGTLIDVGTNKISVDEVKTILLSKKRSMAGKLVSPKPLCLIDVKY